MYNINRANNLHWWTKNINPSCDFWLDGHSIFHWTVLGGGGREGTYNQSNNDDNDEEDGADEGDDDHWAGEENQIPNIHCLSIAGTL